MSGTAGGGGTASGSAVSSSAGQGGGGGTMVSGGGRDGSGGGSSGAAGALSQAGAGGMLPVSGAAGEAGTSGAAGASGASGASGDPLCGRRDTGDIQAWLYQEIADLKSNEIHPFITLTNAGLNVPLNQLVIRYYFSGEAAGDWQTSCLWVTKSGDMNHGYCDQGVSVRILPLDPPTLQADQYLEISFAGVTNAALSSGFPIEARTMFWRVGHPTMNQENDYSFAATGTDVQNVGTRAYKQTLKVTVYRNGVLVWGEEPCP